MKIMVAGSVIASLLLIGAGVFGDAAGHDENFLIVVGLVIIAINIAAVLLARHRGRI